MSTESGRPRMRADAVRNREAILAAARELFAEQGTGSPMEEIAARAQVGVGTLYRRFPNRDNLIREAAAELFTECREAGRAALESEPDAWHALSALLLYCARPEIGTLSAALQPWLEVHRATDPQLQTLTEDWIAQVAQIVSQAQADGDLRGDVSEIDILVLLGQLTCHLPQQSRQQNRLTSQRFVTLLLDGLRTKDSSPLPGSPL